MNRLLYLLIFPLTLLGQTLLAQQAIVDSLKQVVESTSAEEEKLTALLELGDKLFRAVPDEAISYSETAKELAIKLNDKSGLALALKNIGLGHYQKGDYVEALVAWDESLKNYEGQQDQEGIANILSNIGATYYNQGNDAQAIEYYLRSLKVAEELDDKSAIARATSNIGAAYDIKRATSENALLYYKKALPVFLEIDQPISYAITLANMGSVYFEDFDRLDSAYFYFSEAERVFEENGEKDPYTLFNLGQVQAREGRYDEAIRLQKQAFEVAKDYDWALEMAQSLTSLGQTYRMSGDPKAALVHLKEAETIALEIESFTAQEQIYEEMSQVYALLGQYEEAFNSQIKLKTVSDTIYNNTNDNRIAGLVHKFESDKKDTQIALLESQNEQASILRNFLFATAIFLIITVAGISYSYWFARRSNKIITEERNRSESILLNILPEETAEELKHNGKVKAKRFEQVTVMFTDFKEFTEVSKGVPPEEIVKSVDYYFRHFDEIISRHNLEKIKTIGDAYMCAGGLPIPNATHQEDAINAGLEIVEFVKNTRAYPPEGIVTFEVRVGIHTGPVVAGVVGTKKFQYDIWGSTVNLASMMETNSEPNRVNISNGTYELIKDKFSFEYRGEVIGKHGGKYKMYFVGDSVDADVLS